MCTCCKDECLDDLECVPAEELERQLYAKARCRAIDRAGIKALKKAAAKGLYDIDQDGKYIPPYDLVADSEKKLHHRKTGKAYYSVDHLTRWELKEEFCSE
jgi:hypothetical protein